MKCPHCCKEMEATIRKELKAWPKRGELYASVKDWPVEKTVLFVECSCGYWDIINESDSTPSD